MTFYEAVISMEDGYVVLDFASGIGHPTSVWAFAREVEAYEKQASPDWSFDEYTDTRVTGAALALAIRKIRPKVSKGIGDVVLEDSDPVRFADSLDENGTYVVMWGDY